MIQDHLDEGGTSNEPTSSPFPSMDSSFPLMCYDMSDIESLILIQAVINSIISEFMQQVGRKKRTANCLCVTNMTRLLLTCLVVIFTNMYVFWSFTKRLKESEVWRKVFSNKINTLVTQGLPSSFLSSPVLLSKFTIDTYLVQN